MCVCVCDLLNVLLVCALCVCTGCDLWLVCDLLTVLKVVMCYLCHFRLDIHPLQTPILAPLPPPILTISMDGLSLKGQLFKLFLSHVHRG